jgi:tetratricopeptide (TPR) repeat protein
MVSPSGMKLGPSELDALEQAFTSEPNSDAYRPLAEAYLALGRFMEAMVVSKKGVKAHPGKPEPRVLLARVYAGQGKDRKALEELAAVLKETPGDVPAHLLAARIHLRSGEKDPAEVHLRQVLEAAPGNEEALALAREHGLEARVVPPPAPPPAALEVTAAPAAPIAPVAPASPAASAPGAEAPAVGAASGAPAAPAAVVPDGSAVSAASAASAAPAAPAPDASAVPAAPAPSGAPAAVPPAAVPAVSAAPAAYGPDASAGSAARAASAVSAPGPGTPAAPAAPAPSPAPAAGASRPPSPEPVRRAPPVPPGVDLSRYADDEDYEARYRARQGKKGLIGLAITLGVFAVLLGSWYGYTRWRADRDREISKLLAKTNEFIDRDTYASYKQAADTADRILELDPSNFVAHAYLAYIAALRWGEQGEGEDFRRQAQEHLAKAREEGETHGRILAAQAYVQFFQGDRKGAEQEILRVLETGQRSALLYATLGTIQMYAGDLDKAAASLKQAQSLEPNNVRILSTLGQLNRRRGEDARAWTFFDSALRLDKDHADSLLGKALLILDADGHTRSRDERETLLAEADQQIARVLGLPAGAISARQLALAKFARAQLLFARGKAGEAERLEQEAFTLDPSNPDVRLMRGRRLLRAGEVDRAVAEIREAIRIDEKRASFYVDLSRALLARPGGAREAVASLETARKSLPDSGQILVLLGDARRQLPDPAGARAAYEQAVEVDGGKNPEARARLGQLLREAKEWEKARETLELAVQESAGIGGPGLVLALTELGRIFEEGPKPDLQQAFEKYARASELGPSYGPPVFFLGRISAGQRGQAKQARELLEQYLALEPKGEFADQARELLAGLR